MIGSAPSDGKRQPRMRLDAVLEPGVDHADRLSVVVSKEAVVPAVFVACPIHIALQQLAVAEHVRQARVESVETLVQVGSALERTGDREDVDLRVLVVLAIASARLQVRYSGKARTQRRAVVQGAVVIAGNGRMFPSRIFVITRFFPTTLLDPRNEIISRQESELHYWSRSRIGQPLARNPVKH